MFKLPQLPYAPTAFQPWLSAESFEFHYGKHHKAYIDNLNKLLDGSPLKEKSLEEIVAEAQGGMFNNAAQAWNHTFFWNCMAPEKINLADSPKIAAAIKDSFGSVEQFNEKFKDAAVKQFGSGWAWLVKNDGGKLEIITTGNADTPAKARKIPVLTCDVWEHAYYIDHRNARAKFVEGFLEHINWSFVEANFAGPSVPNMTKYMK